jgi:hypothetical protein
MYRIRLAAATLFLLTLASQQTEAIAGIIKKGFLFPDNGAANVERNVGIKGMELFLIHDNGTPLEIGDPELPLNISAATVTITITPAPTPGPPFPNCFKGNLTPPPGQCGFDLVDGQFPNSVNETIRVIYNDVLPATAPVQVAVQGISPSNGPVFNLPGSNWQFTTKAAAPPRAPASVELVFDISGSMVLPAVPQGTITRMKTLQDSAQTFFAMLKDHAMLGDKLGAVFFSTTATPFNPDNAATNLLSAQNPQKVDLVERQVLAQVPTAMTSIGDGLLKANTAGFAPDPTPNATKYVLLFSDGEQNTPPCVGLPNSVPCTSTLGTSLQVDGAAYPADIRVCTVTAGRMSAPGYVLQQKINNISCPAPNTVHIRDADPTDPTKHQSLNEDDLETYFNQVLATILYGDKFEFATNTRGTISRGVIVTEKFLANANDVSLSIQLSWSSVQRTGEEDDRLPFRLKAPDGTLIDVSHRTQLGQNMSYTTVHFPLRQNGVLIHPKGEWHIELGGPIRSELDYHLTVMLDNPTIASEFKLEAQDIGTGEAVPIRVKLTHDGAPVLNATVEAQMQGPRNGLGNILARTPSPQGTPNAGGDKVRSAAYAKLLLLMSDPASASLFQDQSLPTLTLLDNGSAANGDGTARDGIYSGLFKDTFQEGHYFFTVKVRGTTPTEGDFQRTWRLSTFVLSKPVAARTEFKVLSSLVQPDNTVLVRLGVTPRDALGNYLGPDYLDHMTIRSTEGGVTTPLDDKLDGSYEITYRLPSGASNPTFNVEVMDQHVVTKSLRELEGGLVQYAAKFVCGKSAGDVVAPGTYFTAINVHNPTDKPIVLRKKFAIALPREEPGPVSRFFEARLGPDQAFEIDCKDIVEHVQAGSDFLKGFAVIDSEVELDIVAVYTTAGREGWVTTLHLERVPPQSLRPR